MVKYGKLYRDLQLKEFKGNYIDYKKLKQKIKEMRDSLPRTSQQIITNQRNSNETSIKINFRTSVDEDYSRNVSNASNYDQYGAQFKEFKDLLDQEFQRCFMFFKKIKKQLYKNLNKHLSTSTNYSSYNVEDLIKEIGYLRKTMYLAKCLNEFINDNMTAVKKILKKFDKNFHNYFGNFGPKYILDNLCKQNSDLEYLLKFKIIDEASCIIESNVKLLRECYLEAVKSNGDKNIDKSDFDEKYFQILDYIKDIDELIYFKIQYKEWFYFRKKDNVSTESSLYKIIMFNPILFSAFHKDDLMHKFLSRKEQIKEIEEIQMPLSINNKINIILIFIQSFFYNTLISGIYPLLFLFVRAKNIEQTNKMKYTFLIIISTYLFSYFSIMFYYYFGIKRIKCAYIISYILFFIGSIIFILSYEDNEIYHEKFTLGLLVASRVLIGLGANPTMGKNYILSYASKYFLPIISKYYVFVSILGHALGPLITFIFFQENKDPYNTKIFPKFYYTKYNCFGWYGAIFSFFLLFINLIFFTSPTSKRFHKLRRKNSNKEKEERETKFLNDDFEDTQDKEYYKQQKEKNKLSLGLLEEDEDNEIKSINSFKEKSKLSSKKNNEENNDNNLNEDVPMRKSGTLDEDFNNEELDTNNNNYDVNPLLLNYNNNNQENLNENENGNFSNINMIPRTIDDLTRNEKKIFSYLNRNLLIIMTILFFDNLLKENLIDYSCYYVATNYQESKFQNLFKPKYFSCLISGSYILEVISIFFIFPLHTINTRIKKFLIILMTLTVIAIIPIAFDLDIFYYFIIFSVVFIISSIIEVLLSSYLAYLTPPHWKFSNINAGALPLFMMTFGKLSGCLICLTSFINVKFINNNRIVIILTLIGYGISGFYIAKSKTFRIKAISRIMRKSELETID